MRKRAVSALTFALGALRGQSTFVQSLTVAEAIKTGDLSQVQKALNQGAVNERDGSGLAPLHHAARAGTPEIIRFLLKSGADIEARTTVGGYTALFFAVERGAIDRVRTLLELTANPNPRDAQGFAPLHFAALRGHREVVEALIRSGADMFAEGEGLTPLDAALLADQLPLAYRLAGSRSSIFVVTKDLPFSHPMFASASETDWVGLLHTSLDSGTIVPLKSGMERGGRIASFGGLLRIPSKQPGAPRVNGSFEVPENGAAIIKSGATVVLQAKSRTAAELAAAGLKAYQPKP